MNIVCPLCAGDQTERLVLSWSKGLSHFNASTVSVGLMAEFGALIALIRNTVLTLLATAVWPIALPLVLFGFFKPLMMVARTWGTSQTVLSAETQPPYYFPFGRYCLRGLALLFMTIVAYGTVMGILGDPRLYGQQRHTMAQFYFYLAVVVGVVLLLIGTVIMLGVLYNKKIWPLREAAWQRSFLCKRCGGIFLVPDYDPVGVNSVSSRRRGERGLLPRAHTESEQLAAEAKGLDFDDIYLRKKHRGWCQLLMDKWK